MNYLKNYIKLIKKAQNDPILFDDTIKEKHHIFPRSIFKNNNGKISSKYLVELTTKEHFIAHLLLWKYYDKKYGKNYWKTINMLHAICGMAKINKYKFSIRNINSRFYQKKREEYIKSQISNNNEFIKKAVLKHRR